MKIEFTTDDGKKTILATDYKSAYKAHELDDRILLINVKSSFSALLYAAVHIAKKAAEKGYSTATQVSIYNSCNAIYNTCKRYLKATATDSDSDDATTAAALSDIMYNCNNDADAKDYISIAQDALIESIAENKSIAECILSAYSAVNKHIKSLLSASEKERTQEYITAQNGDIIAITDLFARIINKSKKEYIPSQPPTAAAGRAAEKRAAELGALIKHIAETVLTPVQREILMYLLKNMTITQIANKRKCTVSTVYTHIVNIRYKYSTYLQDNNINIVKTHNIDVAACEADYIRYNNYKRNYNKDKEIDKKTAQKQLDEYTLKECKRTKNRIKK